MFRKILYLILLEFYCSVRFTSTCEILKLTEVWLPELSNESTMLDSNMEPEWNITDPLHRYVCCDIESGSEPISIFLDYMANNFFNDCATVLIYDEYYQDHERWVIETVLGKVDVPVLHLRWSEEEAWRGGLWAFGADRGCRHFVFLLRTLRGRGPLPPLPAQSRVLVVTKEPRAQIALFLESSLPVWLHDVLVVADRALGAAALLQAQRWGCARPRADLVLYRPRGAGAGAGAGAEVVGAWRCDAFTRGRPLAPPFAGAGALRPLGGRVLRVALAPQPPFVMRPAHLYWTVGSEEGALGRWDGVEVRLLEMLAAALRFRIVFREVAREGGLEGAEASLALVRAGAAEAAAAGVYGSAERARQVALGAPHSRDCAVFVALARTALPRYRAIMGPFHWDVWLALTLAYLFAMVPLAFSHHHSLMHLLQRPRELENMFWYVFGTFTNCFTFGGRDSWSATRRCSTLMLIGWYWAFSIIVTACYTGSIIAFVTLPVFPRVIDSSAQILKNGYLVGTLGNGEWNNWFENSSDPVAAELMERMEYLSTVQEGLNNVTSSYYPYAFLGSKSFIEYILKMNYTPSMERRQQLHVTAECFVPLGVSLAFRARSGLAAAVDAALLRLERAGLVHKAHRDVAWAIQLGSKGRLLRAAVASSLKIVQSEEKKLSLDDIQGTFLLLGAGFAIAFFALFWECVHYITNKLIKRCSVADTSTRTNSVDVGLEASTSELISDHSIPMHEIK